MLEGSEYYAGEGRGQEGLALGSGGIAFETGRSRWGLVVVTFEQRLKGDVGVSHWVLCRNGVSGREGTAGAKALHPCLCSDLCGSQPR